MARGRLRRTLPTLVTAAVLLAGCTRAYTLDDYEDKLEDYADALEDAAERTSERISYSFSSARSRSKSPTRASRNDIVLNTVTPAPGLVLNRVTTAPGPVLNRVTPAPISNPATPAPVSNPVPPAPAPANPVPPAPAPVSNPVTPAPPSASPSYSSTIRPTAAAAMEAPTRAPISAEVMSVGTTAPSTPATVKPADITVPSHGSSKAPSSTLSPTPSVASGGQSDMTSPTVGTTSSGNGNAGACPKYNQIMSGCNSVCGNNALCIKYRADGECISTNITTCVHPKGDPCAYECLDGTSADFDQWFVSPYAVPAWDPKLHNNKQIEAIRALDVPRNITQLSINFLFNELNGDTQKGKVATIEFPDKRIVTTSSAVRSIALVNLDYRNIPAAAYAPDLEYLVLDNCLLDSVPAPVLKLPKLNFLNLASNSIKNLTTSITQLPLTALYLDNNDVTTFPSFLVNMSSLKVASFVSNNMTSFTTVERSSAITELALDYNQLTDFAGVLPSLHHLYLRGNQLTGFPTTLMSLTNLQILDLTENALSSEAIEKAAGNLTHPNLVELMLGANGLKTVPDLGNVFPSLKTLWVRNNNIEKVEGSYSGKLDVLKAMSNQIKSFKASFSRLTVLDLTDNKLNVLPDVSSISSQLQNLNVSGNDIETLSSLTSLPTLTSFNASRNSLSTFSLTIPSLRSLDLSNNKLKAIPDSVWMSEKLDELRLDSNPELVNVELSRDHLAFLRRLSIFTMDASAMRKDCPDAWKTDLKGVTVCVTNGDDEKIVLKSGGSSSSAWTWVSVVLGLVAAIAVVVFVFVMRRRRRQLDSEAYNKNGGFSVDKFKGEDDTAGLTQSVRFNGLARSYQGGGIWEDQELHDRRVDYDSIKLDSKIAAGAYGEVWLGTYRMECVAVKKLNEAGMRDKAAVSYFVAEIKLLAQLDHPRIIHFYGVAWTCLTDLCAVIEYMPGGDLFSMLRSNLLPVSRWTAGKLQIALDTVEALTYVHTLDDVLIHRDLKSRNVLLDDDWRAKVTDFGVSRFQREEDATMTSGVGTGRWMAPEVIMGRADYNEKVDIYSFGVILSELDTHQMPYAQSENTQIPLTEVGILQQVASGVLRPNFSRTCPHAIFDIAQKCLAYRPEDRPTSLELAYWLRQLIPMFPREEPARPSSVFMRGTNVSRQTGSEVIMCSNASGPIREFSM